MRHTPRHPHSAAFSLQAWFLAFVLAVGAPAVTALKLPIDAGILRDAQPALGIADDFGRWNKTIRLVYDPDGAPAAFSNSTRMLALIQEAYGYWSLVSGVRFELTLDAGARDDRNSSPSQRDGLVRVSWGAIGGAAGQAGPTGSFFDDDLGYFPYDDGSVELNNGTNVIASEFELVGVLVHELGHLLGLGHSDNPDSVMYANPYNHLRYPRADDIRAVQVMYGAPATPVNAGSPIPAWLYTPPPQASASATQFLFKPNTHPQSGNGAYFEVSDATITSVTGATANDEFVWFVGAVGGTSTSISVDAKFIVVDPAGYVYDERDWALTCGANSSCLRLITVAEASAMKTLPGTWKVYVVNKATNQTLVTASIPVNATAGFNRAPAATVTAVPGSTPAQAQFTVTSTDPEGHAIEVVWHPPGLSGPQSDVRSNFASGGSASLNVNFSQTGTHTFYIEVRDAAARYGDGPGASAAGEGFQTLLRVTATLPAATIEVVSTQDAGSVPGKTPSQQVLAAVAKTPSPLLVANSGGGNAVSNASVGLSYGASSDQGATTRTTFTAGDNVIIAGGISPQAADIGKAAEVFVVVRSTVNGVDSWTYRNTSGVFVPWPSVSIALLQPAYTVAILQASQAFEIHNGSLIAAQHRIYVGYRLSGGTTLFYTGQAHTLSVGN